MNDTEFGQRLTDRMTKSERDQSFPDSVPRDAATLMLIDRSGPEPKVLLGRRHASHKFMPGKFVFPGGRIEAQDGKMQAASELDPRTEAKLALRPRDETVPPPRAFALAAVREMFETEGKCLGPVRFPAPVKFAAVKLTGKSAVTTGKRILEYAGDRFRDDLERHPF